MSRPPPRHDGTLPRVNPLPCYIPLLGGPRPRRPRRLRHLLPHLLRSRPVLLPHRTSLRAGEEGGGVGAPGGTLWRLSVEVLTVRHSCVAVTCMRSTGVAPNTNMKNAWFGALDRGMCIRAGVAGSGWGRLGAGAPCGGKASWGRHERRPFPGFPLVKV